ncbi:MAG: GtrA family protein [Rikenellaceae bacterium]|nr:GtrA family protein [Rikenellaceae bacterium]
MNRAADTIRRGIDLFYVGPLKRLFPRELFRYAACGGMNMALDALYYYLIYHYLVAERFVDLGFVVISPHIASLMAVFPITFLNGFWLNRHVAFRSSTLRTGTQLSRYLVSVAGAILLNYLCMKCFVEGLHIWATPSKLLTTAVSSVYSFLAAKYFTFRTEKTTNIETSNR